MGDHLWLARFLLIRIVSGFLLFTFCFFAFFVVEGGGGGV